MCFGASFGTHHRSRGCGYAAAGQHGFTCMIASVLVSDKMLLMLVKWGGGGRCVGHSYSRVTLVMAGSLTLSLREEVHTVAI